MTDVTVTALDSNLKEITGAETPNYYNPLTLFGGTVITTTNIITGDQQTKIKALPGNWNYYYTTFQGTGSTAPTTMTFTNNGNTAIDINVVMSGAGGYGVGMAGFGCTSNSSKGTSWLTICSGGPWVTSKAWGGGGQAGQVIAKSYTVNPNQQMDFSIYNNGYTGNSYISSNTGAGATALDKATPGINGSPGTYMLNINGGTNNENGSGNCSCGAQTGGGNTGGYGGNGGGSTVTGGAGGDAGNGGYVSFDSNNFNESTCSNPACVYHLKPGTTGSYYTYQSYGGYPGAPGKGANGGLNGTVCQGYAVAPYFVSTSGTPTPPAGVSVPPCTNGITAGTYLCDLPPCSSSSYGAGYTPVYMIDSGTTAGTAYGGKNGSGAQPSFIMIYYDTSQ